MFANGMISCNRKASSFEEGRQILSRYVRQLQKRGFPVCLRDVKIILVSASHTLNEGLDPHWLARDITLIYEPEIFQALNFKMEGVNFCCFHTGKVVFTGTRHPTQIADVIYPMLIELELYIREVM